MQHNGHRPDGFYYRRRYLWIEYPAPLDETAMPEPGVETEEARPRFQPDPAYGPWTDDDGAVHPGFAVCVLANPSGAEVREERELFAAWYASRADDDLDAYLQAMAPRVRAWRAFAADDAGTVTPIPAPGEVPGAENPDQWRAFFAIPQELMIWIIGQIRIAHVLPDPAPDPKAGAAAAATASTTSTPPGPTATTTRSKADPAPTRQPA